MRTYFTLATRDGDGAWSPQFGDYERDVVLEEMTDWHDSGVYKKKDMRIVKSGAKQADIDAAIDNLNKDWRNG